MMNAVRGWKSGLAALFLALPVLVGAARAEVKPAAEPLISPDEMLSIDQIHPGMQGYGKSVFQGTKIERFNVTVLGVLRKMDYDGDMILIRINDGPPVTSGAGVSAGMSGSPIYVDGKLIGALAFAWPFAKDPVAGVTPIAQMLNVYQPGSAPRPQAMAKTGDLAPRDGPLKLDGQLFARARVVPERGLAPAASTGGMMYLTPVATPIMCSGMGRTGVDALQRTLHRYSAMVMPGPGAPDLPLAEHPKIEPGSAVGVQLLGGDVDSTAIGTVTYVKGDHVIAFGHPMFGLGSIDMPMTTAYIHGVISTQEVSFKMGSSIDTVGHITQDRNWSIGGKMGQPAKSVEAQFTITDADRGVHRDYHVRAAVQRDVTPALIYGSLINAVNSVSPPASGTTRGTIEVWPHGMAPIKKENIFSQSEKPSPLEQLFGDPFASMPLAELLQIMNTLEVNSFGSVPVDKIHVTVEVSEKRNTATIERAYADRKRVRPGDTVKLGVVIQPADGPKQTEEFEVKIPGNIPAGRLQIGVAGGSSTERVRQMMMIVRPQAKSLTQLLQQFAERERNNDLTVEIAQPVAGVAVSGYEFPNLPNVVVEVLTGATASGVRMTRSHLRQTRSTPWVLSGAALLSLDVDADEKDKSGPLPALLPTAGLGGMGSLLDLFRMGAGGDAGGLLGDDGQASTGDDQASAGLRNLLRLAARAGKGGKLSGADAPDDAKMPSFEELQKILSGDSTGTESTGGEGGEVTEVKTGVARAPGVWKMDTAAELQNGKLEGALISSRGELALAPQAKTLLTSPDRFFWAQTSDKAGNVYVGGWLNGEITRINARGEISTLYNAAPEVAVTALTSDAAGTLYAASEPSGSIYRITPDGQATVVCKLTGQRVWALCKSGADLYAGTGSDGRLYRITPDGQATVVFTAPDRHILSLADDGKGALYLGTYPRGKVFRLRDGKTAPVYEVPNLTVTSLEADGHGNVYIGTSPHATVIKVDPSGTATTLFQSREKHILSLMLEADGSVVAGTGSPARVYRIAPDKTVSTLWDPKAADVLSLSRDGSGNLYATTAGPTQIVQLTARPAESGTYTSPVLNAKALARWGAVRWLGPQQGTEVQTRSGNTSYPDGTWSEWSAPYRKTAGENVTSPAGQYIQYRVVMHATQGQPPPVVRNLELFYRTRNRAPELKLQSPATGDVLSGTRAIKWTAKDPDGDRLTYDIYYAKEGSDKWVKIGTRTGKTQGESGAERDGDDAGGGGDAAQGLPVSLQLGQAVHPVARPSTVAVSTRSAQAAVRRAARTAKPQPAPSRAAAVKSTTLAAKPAKADEADKSVEPSVGDDDGLEGSGSINWNTKNTPDGRYRIKITATDSLTSPDEPATVEVLSEPVQVVNTPPVIQLAKALREGPAPPLAIPVMDAGTYVSSAEYRVDGGEWIGAAAVDGIFDSPEETIRIDPARLKPGKHVLELRARDAAGNEATVKVPYTLAAAPSTVAAPKVGK